MALRTDLLVARVGLAVGAGYLVATVPADERWLIKNWRLSNYTGAALTFDAYATDPRSGSTVDLVIETVNNGKVLNLPDWCVVPEGADIHIIGAALSCGVWISGARLAP